VYNIYLIYIDNGCKLAWKSLRDSLKYHNKVRKAEEWKCWRRSSGEAQRKGVCRVGIRSVHGLLAGRVFAKKVGSGQMNFVTFY